MGPACELCGGDRFEDLLVAYDRVVARRDDFRYCRCRSCGLVLLEPGQAVADAYPPDYGPHQAQGPDPARRRRRRRARGLLRPRGSGRLLDVGCGSGRLLAQSRDIGWTVSGIEPNERAARACRQQGLEVETADLFQATLPEAHFDAIFLHHVIEHIPSPVEALDRIRKAVAPGGVVVVVTPNLRSLGFRIYGSCWYAIDAPRHVRLFEARTLRAMARRAGLETASVRSEPSSRVLAHSRHYQRTQGPVLPPGLAARTAILERSREADVEHKAFRRAMRPVSRLASRFGWGETLRAELVADEVGR